MNALKLAATCAAAMVLSTAATGAVAQNYPAKPVRVVIPWPTGGLTDIAGRLIFAKVGEQTGDLSVMLGRVANIYETAVSRQLLRLTSILTPALTLLFGGLVGGLLVSVMGAIVGLNDLALR